MSKMSRLLRGELNKILMRPILYIITGVIVLALFFSVALLGMDNRGSFEYAIDGASKEEAMTSFIGSQSMNKTIAEKKVEDAYTKLEYYSTLNSTAETTITAQLKVLLSESDSPRGCQTILRDYSASIQELERLEQTTASSALLTNRKEMLDTLTQAKNILVNSAQAGTPAVLMSQASYDNFINLINDAIYYITAEGSDLNLLATHLIIKDKITKATGYADITGISYFDKLYTIVSNDITNIVLSQEVKDNLIKQYETTTAFMTNTYDNILSLNGDEKATVTQLKEEMLKYFYAADQYNALVEDTIYLEPVKNFSDSKAHIYMSYEKVHLYQINERIAKNNFLISNGLTSNQFSSVFSPTMSSGDKVSAFDLVYFGLEICSFIVLIFCVVLAGGMIAGEQSNGTLKVLATRPFSRNKILTSKILASMIFGTIFIIFSALVLFIIGYALYGLDTTPILAIFNASTVFTISPILLILIYLALIIVKMLFYVLFATMISVVFRSNVGAVAISIFVYFLSALFAVLFTSSSWYAFLPFAGIDFFKFFGGAFASSSQNPLSIAFSSPMFFNTNLWISIVIVTATMLIFTILSYYVFKKREIK